MHKKTLVLAFLIVGALGTFSYRYFTDIQESDRAAYISLKGLNEKGAPKDSVSSQHKKQVRKELWTPLSESNSDTMLHTRLMSDSSRLILSRSLGKEEVVEEMKGVTLFAQESFEGAFQIVRVMIAKDAAYHFKQDRVVATKVKLYRFKLPGHDLPEMFPIEKPLMEGDASWMEFFMKGGRVDLNASNVTLKALESKASLGAHSLLFDGRLATLEGEVKLDHPIGKATSHSGEFIYDKTGKAGGLSEATLITDVQFERPDGSQLNCEKAHFTESSQKMLCDGPSTVKRTDTAKGQSHTIWAPGGIEVDHTAKRTYLFRSEEKQIHFVDAFGEIYADKATIDYDDKEVKRIFMEGKVFMAHSLPSELERSYAYADTAEYFPATMEMILVGDRVLVFDKINQVEVSAPLLRIKRDQVTKKETIRGEGDVRFTLEDKEYQTLKNRFKLEEAKP